VFTFDRRPPYGDFRIEDDGSCKATRGLTDDEEGPIAYLESLTWELVFNIWAFDRIARNLNGAGAFRLGMSFGGFEGAQVDWAGFTESPQGGHEGILLNWRFRPPRRIVSYERDGVRLPMTSAEDGTAVIEAAAGIVSQLPPDIVGIRRTAARRPTESELKLDEASIRAVVRSAVEKGRTDGYAWPA
jgi:hypothetical protein